MSKFLKSASFGFLSLIIVGGPESASAGDVAAGQKVFKKCVACHAVGDGAKNKVGPHLNDVFGRVAGELDGYKYSKAMVKAGQDGLVWDHQSLEEYLKKPRAMIKGTRMAFAGLRKDTDLQNVIAYMKQFSNGLPERQDKEKDADVQAERPVSTQPRPTPVPESQRRSQGIFGLGRPALANEIAAWDIDVRPDGLGLPEGSGTVAQGEGLFSDQCAVCHGDFGEGAGRWPVLAGGYDTLTEERPEKTIGSYWPYLSTVYDYIRRTMPYGDARSLSDNDVYALTAYLLFLNDIVDDETFELSQQNFTDVRLPNEANFLADDRTTEPHYAQRGEPCMTNCQESPAEITMRARILDVTPGSGSGSDHEGIGGVD